MRPSMGTLPPSPGTMGEDCSQPPEGVADQGTKLLSAIGALIDTDDPAQMQKSLASIVDVVGTFYRFSLADSILSELKYK